MDKFYFIIEIISICVIIGALIARCLFVEHKAAKLTKQNAYLRKDNIGLIKHNSELYDENQKLRNILKNHNIPDFENW